MGGKVRYVEMFAMQQVPITLPNTLLLYRIKDFSIADSCIMRWFMQILTSIRPQERNRDYLLQSWKKLKFQCRKRKYKTELQKCWITSMPSVLTLTLAYLLKLKPAKNSMNIIGICS